MPPSAPPPPPGNRGRLAALLLAAALAVGIWAIGQAIVRHNAMQNCIDSGRRDCATRLDAP